MAITLIFAWSRFTRLRERDSVYAYPKLKPGAGFSLGAEDPLPDLYLERIRLKDE